MKLATQSLINILLAFDNLLFVGGERTKKEWNEGIRSGQKEAWETQWSRGRS